VADQSGNGRYAAQATAGARMTYRATGVSGKPAVEGDGVDDLLAYSVPWGLSGAATVGLRFKAVSVPVAASFDALLCLNDGAVGLFLILCSVGGYQNISFVNVTGGGNSVGVNDALDTSEHTLVFTHTGGAAATPALYQLMIDGVDRTSDVVASGAVTTVAGASAIGSYRGTALHLSNARFRRMAIYSAALTLGEMSSLSTWLEG